MHNAAAVPYHASRDGGRVMTTPPSVALEFTCCGPVVASHSEEYHSARMTCQSCGYNLAIRDENLEVIVARLLEHKIATITLRGVQLALQAVKGART